MENPVLFATLLRKVKNENEAVGAANAIEKIMLNAGIIPVRPLPWIIRESFVEGDKPSAVQVAPEDGGVDEDNVTQEDKVSFIQPLPAAPQGPPLPAEGLPPGWTMEQWEWYGEDYLRNQ